jgi:GntR family transcriptional repressor for pyruvate dehydrogenase complex
VAEAAPGALRPRRVARGPNLTEQVTQALRADILAHPGGTGAPLATEQSMADGYGVSRTVMREALSRLKAEGLVVTRQGLGAFIGNDAGIVPLRIGAIDAGDVAAVLRIAELRVGIEVEATALAAQRRTREDLRELKGALDAMASALRDHDVEAGAAADLRFHRVIYGATRNECFLQFFDFIRQFYRDSLAASRRHSARREASEAQAHEDHAAVYRAILARDADAARAAARELLRNTVARMVEQAGARRAPAATRRGRGALAARSEGRA